MIIGKSSRLSITKAPTVVMHDQKTMGREQKENKSSAVASVRVVLYFWENVFDEKEVAANYSATDIQEYPEKDIMDAFGTIERIQMIQQHFQN
ncbi:hypothetical protein RFI_31395, partial [Reticulomyxa filosa]